MITVFNREMLYMTYDDKSYKNACDVLNEYNIDYKVKVKYSSHGRKSNVGITSIEYKIFVNKKDYNSAKGALSKHREGIYDNY